MAACRGTQESAIETAGDRDAHQRPRRAPPFDHQMDLYLRKVIHPQAHDNYRVLLKDDDLETDIGSIGAGSNREPRSRSRLLAVAFLNDLY